MRHEPRHSADHGSTMSNHNLTRRELLQASGLGLGALAFDWLTAQASTGQPRNGVPGRPHFEPQADAVILLMQNGGPSQMDLFDRKPALARLDGQIHNERVEMFQRGSEQNRLLASPFRFRRYGRSGVELSEVIPHLGSVADEFCLVRSMVSEHNNHTEALVLFNTGKIFPGRPALGSWISYGLGTLNEDLPAYLVLRDPDGYNTSGTLLWQNGWLPAAHRGTEISSRGAPVLNLRPAAPRDSAVEQANLDFLSRMNEAHRRRYPHESDLEARIQNHELAARMQLSAGAILDHADESPATRRLYGLDDSTTAGYGLRLLLARRLVESGVRFVQVLPPVRPQFQPWDAHNNVKTENEAICAQTDLPSVRLIKDLKQRGLLQRTIVIWSGEFGRLPVSQNGAGRDHNRNAFSLIVAGGGFKAAHVHGATDDVGYRSVAGQVTVPDLHATILHQLGIDHDRLVYRHHGSDETLTDARVTRARVIGDILERPARQTTSAETRQWAPPAA
jgi:hypothetical protein